MLEGHGEGRYDELRMIPLTSRASFGCSGRPVSEPLRGRLSRNPESLPKVIGHLDLGRGRVQCIGQSLKPLGSSLDFCIRVFGHSRLSKESMKLRSQRLRMDHDRIVRT
jgi:hypothetical protein